MLSFTDILRISAVLAVASAHGVILGAQGDAGSPASVGFKVDPNLARNCTTINPCQQDATLIRDQEIKNNVVNECGRTEISGNIDVGENTENALAAGAVTQVKEGSEITVTIHQVNADGAGPYACDLDPTSNSLGATGQIPLEVTNNVPGVNGFSQAKAQQFNITVKMPADLKCTGASTGNVCTVRCRNNAVAGPFGGCFPVQQLNVQATKNTPQNIKTAQDLDGVLKKVQDNNKDLPAAIKANQIDGSAEGQAATEAANKLLGAPEVVTKEFPATNTGPSVDGNTGNAGGNANAGTGNGNANAGNGNANAGNGGGRRKGKNANGNGANAGNAAGAANGANQAGANTGAATGNGNGNGRGRKSKRANANQKRESSTGLRWAKRYVVPGADFEAEVSP